MERSRADVEKLITDNRGLVRLTARRYYPSHVHDQDFLQSGLIGLWKAAKAWKEKGKFQPFARRCILNNMKDYLRAEKCKPREAAIQPQEEAVDYEDDNIGSIDLQRRINAAWPPNSEERFILIALSHKMSKQALAVQMGKSMKSIQRLAEKAYKGIEKEDG